MAFVINERTVDVLMLRFDCFDGFVQVVGEGQLELYLLQAVLPQVAGSAGGEFSSCVGLAAD